MPLRFSSLPEKLPVPIGCESRILRCHNRQMKAPPLLALFVAPMLLISPIEGQVYRCKTPGGGTEYSQIPCGKDAQLVQQQRDSIDTTSPPSDPFGVQRERNRQAREADANARKFFSDSAGRSGSAGSAWTPRQIDHGACERADRDAKIEAGHARKDAAEIRRKQKLADWECGRTIPDEPASTAPKSKPTLARPPLPNPVITNCDQGGCWDSNGGRYTRGAGNTFFGPNGACTATAAGLVCP